MTKQNMPLICVLLAVALVLGATRLYPGGTLENPRAVGFDWSHNYLTQLFRPAAVNGQANTGRPWAIAGMWLFCCGIGELFRRLARQMVSTWHGKWVRIFGTAAMAYASLTVTRMHDLMVTIATVFFVCAAVVLLHWLWSRRRLPQCIAGIANLILVLTASFVYYGQIALATLPALQKLVFLSSAAWLFWLAKPSTPLLAKSASA